jgi:hypothetical protein
MTHRNRLQDPTMVQDREVPSELRELCEKIASLPSPYRDQLAPLAEEAAENARFRQRAMGIARDGLERFRLDLTIAQFDLEATRRERDALMNHLDRINSASWEG